MSADNGIYVLRTLKWPTKVGDELLDSEAIHEYRVEHCQYIEDIDVFLMSDLEVAAKFNLNETFSSPEEAYKQAEKIEKDCGYVEYGINRISKHAYFPNITKEAAMQALDCFMGASPVKASDEYLVEIEVLGGCAEVVRNDGVNVVIKDYDNKTEDEDLSS